MNTSSIGTLFIYVTILVIFSPAIWVAWWLIADLVRPYPTPVYRHTVASHNEQTRRRAA